MGILVRRHDGPVRTKGWSATAAVIAVVATTGCSTTYAVEPPDVDQPAPPPGAFTAQVERVVDGDTFIAVRDGARLRVRLIGIDAPESVRPDSPVDCWGPESSAVLSALLAPGNTVRAAYQQGGERDRFGRELWDVWLPGGRFVQGALVRQGAARAVAYEPQVTYADYLDGLEAAARRDGRGLFGGCPR